MHSSRGTGRRRLDIRHLPADILLLISSSLPAQDIARCISVCHCFLALFLSNTYLQYRLELGRTGMIDGDSNALPLSERLRRLRQYSSRFREGDFDYEDLAKQPDYALRMRNLRRNAITPGNGPLSAVYARYDQGESESLLSVFSPGSAQGGVPSISRLLPVSMPKESRVVKKWAIDRAQDLLVTVEWAKTATSASTGRKLEEVHFYSFSGSKPSLTPHPAATLPSLIIFPPGGVQTTRDPYIFKMSLSAEHAIWEVDIACAAKTCFIDVWNWMTGQLVKRIDVGRDLVNFIPFDDAYILITPRYSAPCVDVYGLSGSAPNHPICTLELPHYHAGKIPSCRMSTGERPATSEGYFRADRDLTMVSLTIYSSDVQYEYASILLIPRATILAHIQAAERRQPEGDTAEQGARVSWTDWDPRGCLRLRLQLPHRSSLMSLIPFGSRAPVVAFHRTHYRSDTFYVFDVNPLAARHAKHFLTTRHDKSEGTAIIEDVEDVLPEVVDPECSTIPYVVYQFKLPYTFTSSDWSSLGRAIRAVEMSLTEFTVKFHVVGAEESLETWTV